MKKWVISLLGLVFLILSAGEGSTLYARKVYRSPQKRAAIIGGSAAGGALVGGLAGGGKGALIGAGVGGAGGYLYDRATRARHPNRYYAARAHRNRRYYRNGRYYNTRTYRHHTYTTRHTYTTTSHSRA